MQIKLFTIPVPGGEGLNEELNIFLRTRKILQVENQLVQSDRGVFWCFCIRYLDNQPPVDQTKKKTDYRQVLDEESFKRFSRLREIRKQIAQEESIPAYAVFTDEELAAISRYNALTIADLRKVKGVGEKKIEKYGQYFLKEPANEES